MPMPRSARNRNKRKKLGASPAGKLQTEYHPIEIISGALRPIRSASQPLAVAPTRRIHRGIVSTAVTSVTGTSNSLASGTRIDRKAVKSQASGAQRAQAATEACHWSLVASLHHGMLFTVSTAAIIHRLAVFCCACVSALGLPSERPLSGQAT